MISTGPLVVGLAVLAVALNAPTGCAWLGMPRVLDHEARRIGVLRDPVT
jgi:hypothetical protein